MLYVHEGINFRTVEFYSSTCCSYFRGVSSTYLIVPWVKEQNKCACFPPILLPILNCFCERICQWDHIRASWRGSRLSKIFSSLKHCIRWSLSKLGQHLLTRKKIFLETSLTHLGASPDTIDRFINWYLPLCHPILCSTRYDIYLHLHCTDPCTGPRISGQSMLVHHSTPMIIK